MLRRLGGCFTDVSRDFQIGLSNMCITEIVQFVRLSLGTREKFQLEIVTMNMISDIIHFHEINLGSSRNASEITPRGGGLQTLILPVQRERIASIKEMEVKGTWVNLKDIREVKAKSKQTEIYLSYPLMNKHNAK